MKKLYIKPYTETVNVRLYSSVMDDSQGHFGPYSEVAGGGDDPGYGDAKENNIFFDIDDNDLWADGGDTGNSYDLWSE